MGVENHGYSFQEAVANMELHSNRLWKQYSADSFDIAYARLKRHSDHISRRFQQTTVDDIMASIKVSRVGNDTRNDEKNQLNNSTEKKGSRRTTDSQVGSFRQCDESAAADKELSTDNDHHKCESNTDCDPGNDELFLHPSVDDKVHQQLQVMDFDEELDLSNNPLLPQGKPSQVRMATDNFHNPYWEAVKTVGMRLGSVGGHNDFVEYNNPFDPRLYFNGLLPGNANDRGVHTDYVAPCSYPPAEQNVLLGVNNISDLVEHHTTNYKRVLQQLRSTPHDDDSMGTPVKPVGGNHTENMENLPIDISVLNNEELEVVQKVLSRDIRILWGDTVAVHPEGGSAGFEEGVTSPLRPKPIKRPRTVPWAVWPDSGASPVCSKYNKTTTLDMKGPTSQSRWNKRKLDKDEVSPQEICKENEVSPEHAVEKIKAECRIPLGVVEEINLSDPDEDLDSTITETQEDDESTCSSTVIETAVFLGSSSTGQRKRHFWDDNDLLAGGSLNSLDDPELEISPTRLVSGILFPKRSLSDPDIHRSLGTLDTDQSTPMSASCQSLNKCSTPKKSKPLNPEALDYFPSIHVSTDKSKKMNNISDWFSAAAAITTNSDTDTRAQPEGSSKPDVAISKSNEEKRDSASTPNFSCSKSTEFLLVKTSKSKDKHARKLASARSAKSMSKLQLATISRKMKHVHTGRHARKLKEAIGAPWKRHHNHDSLPDQGHGITKNEGDMRPPCATASSHMLKTQQQPIPIFKPLALQNTAVLHPVSSQGSTNEYQHINAMVAAGLPMPVVTQPVNSGKRPAQPQITTQNPRMPMPLQHQVPQTRQVQQTNLGVPAHNPNIAHPAFGKLAGNVASCANVFTSTNASLQHPPASLAFSHNGQGSFTGLQVRHNMPALNPNAFWNALHCQNVNTNVKPHFTQPIHRVLSEQQLCAQIAQIQGPLNAQRQQNLNTAIAKSIGINAPTVAALPQVCSVGPGLLASRQTGSMPNLQSMVQPQPENAANVMKKIEFTQLIHDIMQASKPSVTQQVPPFFPFQHAGLPQQHQPKAVPPPRPSDINIMNQVPPTQMAAWTTAPPQGTWNQTTNIARWPQPGAHTDKPLHEPLLAQIRPNMRFPGHRLC